MPRKYKKKNKPSYIDDVKVKDALAKIIKGEVSIRKAAKTATVSEFALRKYLKRYRDDLGSFERCSSGGHTSLPERSERELAFCLNLKARWGFALTTDEVKRIVYEYVSFNYESETELGSYLRKYCRFKVKLLIVTYR